jgi:hypothetical protein
MAEMTPVQFANVVEELRKSRAMQRGAWEQVQKAARAYAMMKLHARYMENGSVIQISHADKVSYLDHFKSQLLDAAERAFMEDALMGAAIAENT